MTPTIWENIWSSLFHPAAAAIAFGSPKGDGHPVLVIPGFCTGPDQTMLLRNVLRMANYDAHDWGQGINLGPSDQMDQKLDSLLVHLHESTGQKVSLVGWSLGGLYARALANQFPDKTRRVITLASPHRAKAEESVLRPLFELLSPTRLDDITEEQIQQVLKDPPVPLTSIYTKSDECVNWRDCLCDETQIAKNVEVYGNHLGLTHNPTVLKIILEQLARQA